MDQIKALREKAAMNLLKKQQVCTDSILKDFNYQISLPLEHAHMQKQNTVLFNSGNAASETDSVRKDVRAPVIEMSFDI